MKHERALLVATLAVLACVSTFASAAAPNYLSVTIGVAQIPATIVLCRDPQAYAAVGFDEQYEILVDVDNKSTTGGDGGADAAILLTSNAEGGATCTPSSPMQTQTAFTAKLAMWDNTQGNFVDTGVVPTTTFDLTKKTITLTTQATGVLAGLNSHSILAVSAAAAYHAGANTNVAFDETANFDLGMSVTQPANDVQFCTSPCTTGASYYGLIDIVGVSTSLAPPDEIFYSGFEAPGN